MVERDLGLEKYVLMHPSSLPARRHTIDLRHTPLQDDMVDPIDSHQASSLGGRRNTIDSRHPDQLPLLSKKKPKNIPIGARGRRRSTTILHIGLTPNLDGHCSMIHPTPALAPATLSSVSLSSSSQSSAVTSSNNIEHQNNISRDETTLEITFDDSFGCLHYSSSD